MVDFSQSLAARGVSTPGSGLSGYGIGSGSLVDQSAALNALYASPSVERPLEVGQLYNLIDATGAIRIGAQTISIPYYSGMIGTGLSSKYVITAAPAGGAPLFGINTLGDGKWIRSFPGRGGAIYENLYHDATIANASGITAYEVGASAKFSNITTLGIERLANQATGIKSGETSAPYVDTVTIDNVTGKQPAGTLFYIDGSGTGDGWDVNQLHMALNWSSYDGNGKGIDSTAIRPRALKLVNKNGFTIRNGLNGDYLFIGCDAGRITGMHMETGSFEFRSSSGSVVNSSIWKNNESTGDLGVVPLRVSNDAGPGGSAPGIVSFKNDEIILQPDFLTYGYSTALADLQVPSTYRGLVEIENTFRRFRGTNPALTAATGINTAGVWPEFDDYSHFASMASQYDNEWFINGDILGLPSAPGVLNVAGSVPAAEFGKWLAGTGTWFARVAICTDWRRRQGVIGSNEVSAAMTNGGPALKLAFETNFTGMALVYLGTATNSYTFVFRVPVIAGTVLPLNGLDCMGYPAIARSAGAADPLNSGVPLGGSIRPGEPKSLNNGSDAYGHAEFLSRYDATTSTGSFPQYGSWRRGDIIRWTTPQMGGAFQGYRRLNDCTTASPTHTLYTPDTNPSGDWEPIVVGIPEATAAELGAATNAINAIMRKRGRIVWNSTTSKLMVKLGSTAGSNWSQIDTPATVITPV